ncbi:hypothetical protein ILUMI_16211 [Ignelater luminosus]|uniref:Uncharacterized protein n=1 Tax=Ignelater luminosus TaxID=2038154 RepID=A0A8K0G963_IGNLU|nr:hypothetical protein ILUMI_16211 [Ignelater luminosus]
MYNNSIVPRKFVQFVIRNIEKILCKGFRKVLNGFKRNRLSELNKTVENLNFLEQMVNTVENRFQDVNTEYKCTKLYEESGLLVSSKTVQIGEKMKPSRSNNDVVLKPVSACIKMISLIDLFTNVLTSGELLNDMKTHYSELLKETNVVSNFVQCNLWKSKVFNYDDKTVFPLILFFDDYELGNALGSRAGKNKLGAVYVSLPSLPPHITSKLSNIFLFALFYSNDRKLFGNNIFSKLIEELQYLQDNGILVLNETVYFKVGLIFGDNLGVHGIFGFTESFSCTYSCRFCRVDKNRMHTMTTQDDDLMRSINSYNHDVLVNNVTETGIKENCI